MHAAALGLVANLSTAEPFVAYLAHMIEAHTDGALERWRGILSPVRRGER